MTHKELCTIITSHRDKIYGEDRIVDMEELISYLGKVEIEALSLGYNFNLVTCTEEDFDNFKLFKFSL